MSPSVSLFEPLDALCLHLCLYACHFIVIIEARAICTSWTTLESSSLLIASIIHWFRKHRAYLLLLFIVVDCVREERVSATSIIVCFIWFLRFCVLRRGRVTAGLYTICITIISTEGPETIIRWADELRRLVSLRSRARSRFPFRRDPARCTCVIASPVVIT